MSRVQAIVNNTKNKLHNRTPNELTRDIRQTHLKKDMIKKYNKGRQSGSIPKHKLAPLEIKDKVRILLLKRSKEPGLDYKSYRGTQYTKQLFPILGRSKKQPYKYKVKMKKKYAWYLRGSLLKTHDWDEKTEKHLKLIKDTTERKQQEEEYKRVRALKLESDRKQEKEDKGRRRRFRKRKKFPIFIDRHTNQTYVINSVIALEKLRTKYHIPRHKLKQDKVFIDKLKKQPTSKGRKPK